MYFSADGTQAHIWATQSDSPLCLASEQDFPTLWSQLEVGAVVEIETTGKGVAQVVKGMTIMRANS